VIDLFKLIHEHRDDQRLPLAKPPALPALQGALIHSQDRVKSGLFNYSAAASTAASSPLPSS
jgi:hypothetical protein